MANLQTTYMNITLNNPIIVASSGLTKNVAKIKACAEAGAGAVVLKSLFEEAFQKDSFHIGDEKLTHPEMYEYLTSELQLQYGIVDYLKLIKDAKREVDIPIIASINCTSAKHWVDFSEKIEEAGADALELNVFTPATSIKEDSQAMENVYYEILDKVKEKIKIPVAMKISNNFSSLPHFTNQLQIRGLDGLVLFNRFTMPDIDIKKMELKTTFTFSQKNDYQLPLRWTALLSDMATYDISATTGIFSAEDVIKLILSGASTVQLASVLYNKGLSVIGEINAGLEKWMDENNYKTIDEIKGKLSFKQIKSPKVYLRTQFMEKIRGFD